MEIDIKKQELRRVLRQRRQDYHKTIDQSIIDQQLIVRWKELTEILQLTSPLSIAGYEPIGSELNILELMKYLQEQGYTICLPRIVDDEKLEFTSWQDPRKKLTPDIALVPLLGFDDQGNRLGQGQGYYDRNLKRIVAIGVGYACQQLDNIPICDKDYPMDYILIPEKILKINKDLQ